MQVVLRTQTPDGIEVVLSALVYAKILEEHPAVADLALIDRTIREPDERSPIRGPVVSGSSATKAPCGSLPSWISRAFLQSSSQSSPPTVRPSDMPTATVHVAADDLQLSGSYEPTGDVLYLSAAGGDEKSAPAQQTPEGHAVRLDHDGRVTHLTAINARWLLDQHGELVATLRDGRRLRIDPQDVAGLLD